MLNAPKAKKLFHTMLNNSPYININGVYAADLYATIIQHNKSMISKLDMAYEIKVNETSVRDIARENGVSTNRIYQKLHTVERDFWRYVYKLLPDNDFVYMAESARPIVIGYMTVQFGVQKYSEVKQFSPITLCEIFSWCEPEGAGPARTLIRINDLYDLIIKSPGYIEKWFPDSGCWTKNLSYDKFKKLFIKPLIEIGVERSEIKKILGDGAK